MKTNKGKCSIPKSISCPALFFIIFIGCLIFFAGEAKAQQAPAPEKKQTLSEVDRLMLQREEVRKARLKLLQDESTYQVQYFKPVDRLRKQLDMQEADLYAECSEGKDLKSPQYGFCIAELKRFNDNVKYYNERLDGLKSGLTGHKREFGAKLDDLDNKEREIDRRISLLTEKRR